MNLIFPFGHSELEYMDLDSERWLGILWNHRNGCCWTDLDAGVACNASHSGDSLRILRIGSNGAHWTALLASPAPDTLIHIPHHAPAISFRNLRWLGRIHSGGRPREQILQSSRKHGHDIHLSVQQMHGSIEAVITGTSASSLPMMISPRA